MSIASQQKRDLGDTDSIPAVAFCFLENLLKPHSHPTPRGGNINVGRGGGGFIVSCLISVLGRYKPRFAQIVRRKQAVRLDPYSDVLGHHQGYVREAWR